MQLLEVSTNIKVDTTSSLKFFQFLKILKNINSNKNPSFERNESMNWELVLWLHEERPDL